MYGWANVYVMGDVCLIASNNSNGNVGSGVRIYRLGENSTTELYGSGWSWKYFYDIGNYVFISGINSTYGAGIIVFDKNTQTISKKFNYGYYYDTLSIKDNNYYLECSNKTTNPRILKLNSDDSTIILSKYIVEV